MTEVGFPAFDATVQKTNHLLKHIAGAYGWPKERRNQSYAALRSVLQTLRDRLTVEETAQLAAQLPTLVRGLYYEGWNPTVVPVDMDRAEFLARVQAAFSYESEGGPLRLVHTVVDALKHHVSEGEWGDIRSSMPRDLAAVLI